jgi:hypothetical protein
MTNNNTQLFELDLRTVQQQLRTKTSIRSADILNEVGDFFPVRTHVYHRIDHGRRGKGILISRNS